MCVQGLQIPMHLHRVQVEYELREKLILLRQQMLLAAGNNSRLWDLLLHSVPSFGTLFRHALIALGDSSHLGKREAVQAYRKRVEIRSICHPAGSGRSGTQSGPQRKWTSTILSAAIWRRLRRLLLRSMRR